MFSGLGFGFISGLSGLGSGLGFLVLAFGFVLFRRVIGGLVRSRLVSFVACLAVVVVVPFIVLFSSCRAVYVSSLALSSFVLSCDGFVGRFLEGREERGELAVMMTI